MNRLLGHGIANSCLPLRHALECGRVERKTSQCDLKTLLSIWRSSLERDPGLPVDSVVRKRVHRVVLRGVSPIQSRFFLGHCFGAYAPPVGRLALLLCYAPSGLRFPPSADPP